MKKEQTNLNFLVVDSCVWFWLLVWIQFFSLHYKCSDFVLRTIIIYENNNNNKNACTNEFNRCHLCLFCVISFCRVVFDLYHVSPHDSSNGVFVRIVHGSVIFPCNNNKTRKSNHTKRKVTRFAINEFRLPSGRATITFPVSLAIAISLSTLFRFAATPCTIFPVFFARTAAPHISLIVMLPIFIRIAATLVSLITLFSRIRHHVSRRRNHWHWLGIHHWHRLLRRWNHLRWNGHHVWRHQCICGKYGEDLFSPIRV